MPQFHEQDVERILAKLRGISVPQNPILRARNIVFEAVRESGGDRLKTIERSALKFKSKFNLLIIFKTKYMPLIALIVAFVLGGGGTVAAAQNDLPGEALYGVKLASERVAETFTVGGEAKVEVAAKFAERRAEEIAALKAKAQARSEASVNGERARDVEKFEMHLDATAERLKDKITRLETHVAELKEKNTEGTLKAASNLEARVEVWTDILDAVEESTTRAELKEKLMAVREEAAELKKNALDAQEDALKRHASEQGFESSAQGRVKAAENKLAAVTEFRTKFKARADAAGDLTAYAAREPFYQEAVKLVADAKAALDAKNWQEAWVKANAAFKAMIQYQGPMFMRPLSEAARAEMQERSKERTDARNDTPRDDNASDAANDRQQTERQGTPEQMRAKVAAEATARAAQAITLENKDKLGPVVKEKIRNLALRADVLMAEGKYVEAARLYGQIVLTVKAALNLSNHNTLNVKAQSQSSASNVEADLEVEVEAETE